MLTSILVTAILLPYVTAFPSYADHSPSSGSLKGLKRQLPFDPVAQKIDVTGKHAFVPPGPTDMRGPCTGLNALANHNFIQHNGVTNFVEFLGPCQMVFGMSLSTCTVLAALGVALAGDPVTQKFSIGGPPPQTPLEQLTSILLGPPRGLSGTHNSYETDSSSTRGDSYLYSGDASSPRIQYIQQLLDASDGVDDYTDPAIWLKHRETRFKDSIQNNPYFFYGPISGVLVSEAGYLFYRELFANRSSAEPDTGTLPRSVLLSFLGASEDPTGQLTVNPGHEQIPDNWYRRSMASPYTVTEIVAEIANIILLYPPAGSIGGNTGTTNSFAGLDLTDLTGGVYHAGDLTDPTKLSCFIYSVSQILTPLVIQNLFKNALLASPLFGEWASGFAVLGCPTLSSINQAMFTQFPGVTAGNFF